jgi:hypothetical protein
MSQQLLDQYIPRCGPSWGGGRFDARHRQIDVIRERVRANEPPEEVAEDYDIPVELVRWLVKLRGKALGKIRAVQLESSPGL